MIIMGDRKRSAVDSILGPDPESEASEENGRESDLHALVSEHIDAVHAHDVDGAADAMKAIFAHLDAEPHVEGEHEDMEGY